ncbi:DnaD domain protein [Secundilactobacillus kimchicus]|nr:DnaD domain protein [Secundilactobacillus kimchicus]MBT9672870.1 DnaD domain protein [Secundilactobacillus kimchicus]
MDEFAKALLAEGNTTVATLLVRRYRELGMTNDEFLVYLQLKSFADQGVAFPETKDLAAALGKSEQQVFDLLHQMIEKKLIQIQPIQKKGQLASDAYDFSLIFEKLAKLTTTQTTATDSRPVATGQSSRQAVFQQIEQEFGRPLSPIELEMISQWLDQDHYEPELVLLALKEAVLSQVYSLKYMDRILLSWEKKHLKTAAQVQQDKARRDRPNTSAPTSKQSTANSPHIPLFNIGDQPYHDV